MNLERLGIFLRVVETGSMRAAAAAVHLTQPAVSRNIQLLEEEIGVELFRRQGRGAVLTAAGRALVPRARKLIDESRRAAHEVARSAERDYFDLRLGAIDSVATFLLPAALAALHQRYSGLVVRLNTSRTAVLLDRVAGGALDLAVVASSGPPPGAAVRLRSYELKFFGRKDRFPHLAKAKALADLAELPVVEIEPPPGAGSAMPRETMSYARASNIATVKALVLAGFGVGDLVDFMLTPAERKLLSAAAIPHDPDCALYLVSSATWQGPSEQSIATSLASLLSARR